MVGRGVLDGGEGHVASLRETLIFHFLHVH